MNLASFSILAFSDSVCKTDFHVLSDERKRGWEVEGMKMNSFRTETIMERFCLIIMHLSSLASFTMD